MVTYAKEIGEMVKYTRNVAVLADAVTAYVVNEAPADSLIRRQQRV